MFMFTSYLSEQCFPVPKISKLIELALWKISCWNDLDFSWSPWVHYSIHILQINWCLHSSACSDITLHSYNTLPLNRIIILLFSIKSSRHIWFEKMSFLNWAEHSLCVLAGRRASEWRGPVQVPGGHQEVVQSATCEDHTWWGVPFYSPVCPQKKLSCVGVNSTDMVI